MKICPVATCPAAGAEQPDDAFPSNGKGGTRPQCRVCFNATRTLDGLDARRSKPKAEAPAKPPPQKKADQIFDRDVEGRGRYIVTAAQNNTAVRADFLAALKMCAAHLGAEIIVVPFRYKNPTGHDPGTDLRVEERCKKWGTGDDGCCLRKEHSGKCRNAELWWDPALKPYLLNTRKRLGPGLVLAADVKIQATASSPLSGFEALTGLDSCIIGHPKLQLLSVAVPVDCDPKILTTTGVVTEKNYSNTKAGALGEFHYTLGALMVEVDTDCCHLRQLGGNKVDGSFTDLNLHFTGMGVTEAPPALALITGDVHVDLADPDVLRATFGAGGMVDVLRPQTWIAHDVGDGGSHNPHERGNLFLAIARRKADLTDIRAELQRVVDFVNAHGQGMDVVIVDSNHHDFLRRWVVHCTDHGCKDAKNAELFFETGLFMAQSANMTPGGPDHGDPFRYWMKKLGIQINVRCLEKDEPFSIAGIALDGHGHAGPNGTRGTRKNHARVGVRSFIGHGHAEGIEEGCWQVGTMTPRRQAYHQGAGNNTNTHGVIYWTGKRCLLTVLKRGKWRTV